MIPKSYIPATWRTTIGVNDKGEIGVGFNLEPGKITRLVIDNDGAHRLVTTISDCLKLYSSRSSQSDKSGEMPSSKGSIPDEGVKV